MAGELVAHSRLALTDPNDSQGLPGYTQAEVIEILERIQKCVLWLSTLSVHHANHVRPNPDGSKVGGDQASSASLVSIMTALYFCYWLWMGDRVSVKPHASPEFLNYFNEGFTSAVVEGLNNAIRGTIRRAYGYQLFENFRLHVMVEHGNLPAIPPLI